MSSGTVSRRTRITLSPRCCHSTAVSAENTIGESAQIRFTVETSPIWALVGIALIALILGGLFYVFRTYGRR